MSFNPIIISTSLSLLFGVYSIYGLMIYLEKSEKSYKEQIDTLKETIFDINKKYNETNKKYNDFLLEFEKINDILSKNITNLETSKIELINCIDYDTSFVNIIEDITDKNQILCNTKMNIGLINLPFNNEANEELINVSPIAKIDNLNVGLDNNHGFEILEPDCSDNEDIINRRTRGTSISEINYWAEATKKFIFG